MALHTEISSTAASLAAGFVRLSPDAAFVLDADGRILAANEQAACVYERTEAELTSMSVRELVAPDEPIDTVLSETEDGPVVCVHKRRDGQTFAVEISVNAFEVDDTVLFAVSARDVERLYAQSDELRLARLALDAAWDSIVMHTPDGDPIYFNKAAARNLGYNRAEFAALGPWGWAGILDPAVRTQRLDELRQAGELSFITQSTHKNGNSVFLDVHSKWIETPSGPLIVAVSRDVTEKMQAQELLREMAFHDPLTGLANRALLDDRLEVAIGEARRHGDRLGIAYLDIDDFKPVNDTFGHEVGDRVLQTVGHRLSAAVRDHDTVARMGGDEFVAVFTRLKGADDLEVAAAKLVDAIAKPVDVEGVKVVLVASCGLAMFDPAEDDERSLLMKADLAMYDAKRGAHMTFREKVNGAGGGSRTVNRT